MPKFEGKKTGEPRKNSRESRPLKMLAKLPANYSDLTLEEQTKWRCELAQRILEQLRKT
jgi:hypothetical protein